MSLLRETALIPNAFLYRRSSNEFVTTTSIVQRLNALKKYAASSSLTSGIVSSLDKLGSKISGFGDGLSDDEREENLQLEGRKQILYLRKREATNYKDWLAYATELDLVEGHNEWKLIDESDHYDAEFVMERLRRLEEARVNCDIERMLHLIRTEFSRHLGDMSNLKLYKHSHVGTKDLIDRYINTANDTISGLLDVSARSGCSREETSYILEQLNSARQAFGRSALLLSGGATFGMNHIGVLKALFELESLPRVISGASAGSIVCAVLCVHTDEEMPEILANFGNGKLDVFEAAGKKLSLYERLKKFIRFGTIFDIVHLKTVMDELLGKMTFQEAYNRTRRVLNICVSSADVYELPRLLNYVTAPNVIISSAVCASCSVPVLFSAATLQAKDIKTGEIGPWNPTPQQWIDGSVDNDLPMTRLAEMFNVNNFIVSQVNPHVVPFLLKEEEFLTSEAQDAHAPSRLRWLQTWTDLAKDEALFRMQELVELGFFPTTLTKCASVMSQKYSGDINIYPEISYSDFPYMLTNPTSEFMLQAALCGERATWPKMSRIQNHMKIELALDDAVKQLQTRVVFSPSQVNLRLNLLGAYGVGRGRGVGFGRRGKSTRSNEPLMSRAEGDRGSTQSLPYHVKSLSMSVIGQSLPTIPGSPDPEPLLEMANRVREGALNSTGVETPSNLSPEPDTAITDAFDDNSDVSRGLGSESRRSVSSEGSEGTITQYQHDTATAAHSEPGSSTPRPETPDASDSALSSPTLSIKMPPRPPRNGNPSTPELRYKRLFHQGALPQPILPIVPNTSRGRGDRDPGLSVDLSGAAGDGAPWPSNASPMSWMAAVGLGSR